MKEIVDLMGWPTISKVGELASYNAWLIVQHADHDLVFQKKCLELLRGSISEDFVDISPDNIGFLEDRIMTKEYGVQKYGTQMKRDCDGRYVPFPIIDPGNLNERRASLGMGFYADYVNCFEQDALE